MHRVVAYSRETSIKKTTDGYDVDVYLALQEDGSLLYKLTRVEEGEAIVRSANVRVGIPRGILRNNEHLLVVAEIAALVQFVSIDGINCFGAKKIPPMRDVQFVTSRSLVERLLSMDEKTRSELQCSKEAYLIKQVDALTAYCYGFSVLATDLPSSVSVLEREFDTYGHINLGELLHQCDVTTPLGSVRITKRAIQEYLSLPLNLDLQSLDRSQFSRPFVAVRNVIAGASEIQPSSNQHVKRLRGKFGSGAQSLMNKSGVTTIVDLVPIKSGKKERFIVIGFRQLYSKALQERLSDKGYMGRYRQKGD
ncbi:hypothetical protein [Vibrio owensii]|uniref:hypothetical protein n=1 Tax=Vibrio owensii TaxID=696485 RepID=UPI0018F1DFD6|nr:hypothetical protein [Vibrio owensii]